MENKENNNINKETQEEERVLEKNRINRMNNNNIERIRKMTPEEREMELIRLERISKKLDKEIEEKMNSILERQRNREEEERKRSLSYKFDIGRNAASVAIMAIFAFIVNTIMNGNLDVKNKHTLIIDIFGLIMKYGFNRGNDAE